MIHFDPPQDSFNQQPLPKKTTPPTSEAAKIARDVLREGSQKETKQAALQASHPEVPSLSEVDLPEGLFEEHLLAIPEDNPFFSEDLLLFEDSYRGLLPLNGVRVQDLEEASAFYQALSKDATSFQIPKEDPLFFDYALLQFRKLLTRAEGRALLYQLDARAKVAGSPIQLQQTMKDSRFEIGIKESDRLKTHMEK
ncbi:MAG: hypothetical protein K0S07_903, partial [Chlamydiales bacterium]|nr:hypothetical protein [Chlamydiales bacterium]